MGGVFSRMTSKEKNTANRIVLALVSIFLAFGLLSFFEDFFDLNNSYFFTSRLYLLVILLPAFIADRIYLKFLRKHEK